MISVIKSIFVCYVTRVKKIILNDLGKMFKYCKIFVNSFIWVPYSCDKVCWMVYHKLKDKSHG